MDGRGRATWKKAESAGLFTYGMSALKKDGAIHANKQLTFDAKNIQEYSKLRDGDRKKITKCTNKFD